MWYLMTIQFVQLTEFLFLTQLDTELKTPLSCEKLSKNNFESVLFKKVKLSHEPDSAAVNIQRNFAGKKMFIPVFRALPVSDAFTMSLLLVPV